MDVKEADAIVKKALEEGRDDPGFEKIGEAVAEDLARRMKGYLGDSMDIKEIIYTELRNRGCKLREEVGILFITTPDGIEWDMTIPMVRPPKDQTSKK